MLSDADYLALLPFRDSEPYSKDLDERLEHLAELGFIKSTVISSKTVGGMLQLYETDWVITPLGLDALSAYEKHRAKNAEAKRQQRFQNKLSVASVLVPFISFILGLVVEHYSGLVSVLLKLFR